MFYISFCLKDLFLWNDRSSSLVSAKWSSFWLPVRVSMRALVKSWDLIEPTLGDINVLLSSCFLLFVSLSLSLFMFIFSSSSSSFSVFKIVLRFQKKRNSTNAKYSKGGLPWGPGVTSCHMDGHIMSPVTSLTSRGKCGCIIWGVA